MLSPPPRVLVSVCVSVSLAQGWVLFLSELGFPKVGLCVPGALGPLSQPLNWYLVLQQPIFIVPDAAASSSRLRDHHTARLHVLHVVWHCQESPQCRIPEAEISPALVNGGS